MLRRVTAVAMWLSLTFSLAETVVGEIRDGEVHHETAIEAAAHDHGLDGRSRVRGVEHHEDDDSDPDRQHQHGSGSDHCTHPHGEQCGGVPLILVVPAEDSPPVSQVSAMVSDPRARTILHPPRSARA